MNESKTVSALSLPEATKYVYNSSGYSFNLNRGIVDVTERFRYFKYENISYIAKKVSPSKGIIETYNANRLKEVIGETKIGKYCIKILTPVLVRDGENLYYVTPYKGLSLENYYYGISDIECFSVKVLGKLLKLFIDNGIYYYDFLPRNVIVKGDVIYLLDFENVIFNNKKSYDIRWYTNFLLNWSYIFNQTILETEFGDLVDRDIALNSYPLSKFERSFSNITRISANEMTIRENIMKMVLVSEKRYDFSFSSGLVPMDLCHFVSDLFGTDVDVYFDILFYLIRLKSEYLFLNYALYLNEVISVNTSDKLRKAVLKILNSMKVLVYNIYKNKDYINQSTNVSDEDIVKIFKNELLGEGHESMDFSS